MVALKRGDVVFTQSGHFSAGRVLIKAVSGGGPFVHVGIASGDGNGVYESVPAGLRHAQFDFGSGDGALVMRHKLLDSQELIAVIAEGYVSEVAHTGHGYGAYAHGSAGVMGVREGLKRLICTPTGHGGSGAQWGNTASKSSFYCSNFVARVLIAAHQAGGRSITEPRLNNKILPKDLLGVLRRDFWWKDLGAAG